MNPADPIRIAVAVVLSDGKVLIGRRPDGVPLAGLWEFPGGKVALGETPAETAARECREETGLDVGVGELELEVVHDYPHGRLRIAFFRAAPLDPAAQPCLPFRWVRLADLPNYSFPPANAEMLARLAKPPPDEY